MHHALQKLDWSDFSETLPDDVIRRAELISRKDAFRQAHFPAEDAPTGLYNQFLSPAHRRLIFEEFFWLAFAMGLRRQGREASPKGTVIEINDRKPCVPYCRSS
jgi:ATP-dependent DNA helicase RecG